MNDTKYGFCAEQHSRQYKCANCGYEASVTKMTNFYEHAIVKWEGAVCPKCGFKSFKPLSYDDMLERAIKKQEPK